MADVVLSTKQVQFVLSLGKNGAEYETRTFSVDLPSATTETVAKQRATAFINQYFGGDGAAGRFLSPSLLQKNGWRDDDPSEEELDCLGIQATFIDKTQVAFDI